MDEKEKAEYMVNVLNETEGDLDKSIYDCPICKNKGLTYFVREYLGHYDECTRQCKCMELRRTKVIIRNSGLDMVIKKNTFDRYEAKEEWQKKVKTKAMKFAENAEQLENKCFFIGGGVGSGKTHICTAIVSELMNKGIPARYMLWVKESGRLKSMVNEPEYDSILDDYRKIPVLYIDDFFKVTKDSYGNETKPTGADIKLAYEIINYRYQHEELITIISSERYIGEIEEIDSAVGSRIYEMAVGNTHNILKERSRNYRLNKVKVS